MDSVNNATDDFLAHYGVKGMHWGQRAATIGAARGRQKRLHNKTTKAEEEYNAQTTVAGKAAALKSLKEHEFIEWDNKQTANTMTRGEQFLAGSMLSIGLTPVVGIPAIVGLSYALGNDKKQFKSKYPDA